MGSRGGGAPGRVSIPEGGRGLLLCHPADHNGSKETPSPKRAGSRQTDSSPHLGWSGGGRLETPADVCWLEKGGNDGARIGGIELRREEPHETCVEMWEFGTR